MRLFPNPRILRTTMTAAIVTTAAVLSSNHDVAADQTRYLTSDPGTTRMRMFDRNGNFQNTLITGAQGSFTPNHACLSADGRTVFVPTYMGTSSVLMYDLESGSLLGEIDHPSFVSPAWASLHPNGNLVISDFDGGRVWEYDVENESFVGQLVEEGHLFTAHSVLFNENGSILVLDWWGGQIVRYHADGSFDQILQNGSWLLGPLDMVPSPGGDQLIVTNNALNDVRVFDRETGTPVKVLIPNTGVLNGPEGLQYMDDGSLLVCGAPQSVIRRFDPTTGSYLGAFTVTGNGCVDILRIPARCPADVNNSDAVDIDDILELLSHWGSCGECNADVDGDGNVDLDDLLEMLGSWGECS